MIYDFDQFLMYVAFDQGLPPLPGQVSPDWSSEDQNHRQKIRREAEKHLFHSISHCPMMGGFVALDRIHPVDLQLGFDIEEIARVEDKVVNRVANLRDERPHGDHMPALLWCAREAAYKALAGPDQPHVISQIQLFDWKERQPRLWSFSFKSPGCETGRGYAWEADELQYALCFWKSPSRNTFPV